MSKSRPTQHERANAVVSAVEQAAALYDVPYFRMQSRVVMFEGPQRSRPVFFGKWHDDLGIERTKGMADLLLMPRIRIVNEQGIFRITVPLWVECKSGSGVLTKDQEDFRDYVRKHGAMWVLAQDSADAVLEFFHACAVQRD